MVAVTKQPKLGRQFQHQSDDIFYLGSSHLLILILVICMNSYKYKWLLLILFYSCFNLKLDNVVEFYHFELVNNSFSCSCKLIWEAPNQRLSTYVPYKFIIKILFNYALMTDIMINYNIIILLPHVYRYGVLLTFYFWIFLYKICNLPFPFIWLIHSPGVCGSYVPWQGLFIQGVIDLVRHQFSMF